MQADEEGKHKVIKRSVREIMMGTKHEGMRLWQTIMKTETGTFKGYFPQGKKCEQHKKRAMEYGAQLASEMTFYLLKRGSDVAVH